jgi:hypothetical protein
MSSEDVNGSFHFKAALSDKLTILQEWKDILQFGVHRIFMYVFCNMEQG